MPTSSSGAESPPPRISVSRTRASLIEKVELFVLSADIPIASGRGTPAFVSAASTRQKRSTEMRWYRRPTTGVRSASRSRRRLPRAPPRTSSTTSAIVTNPATISSPEPCTKSVNPSSMRVGSGRLAPRPRYIPANFGRTNTDIKAIAAVATTRTTIG